MKSHRGIADCFRAYIVNNRYTTIAANYDKYERYPFSILSSTLSHYVVSTVIEDVTPSMVYAIRDIVDDRGYDLSWYR